MKDYNFTINLTEEQIEELKKWAGYVKAFNNEELPNSRLVLDIWQQIEPDYLARKESEK